MFLWKVDYNWIESVIRVQLHLSRSKRGKFEDFLEFSVLHVCLFQLVSEGCPVWIYSVFLQVIYIGDYVQSVTFATVIFDWYWVEF